ncbi:MAG: cation:proton antiporter [Duncaniella sp.]|nr:cation:proton antiporter [Duncaniella sp.]
MNFLSIAIPAAAPLIKAPVPIFLMVMAIILLTPLLLNRLKIPYVIGLILAGVAVGPHGFNLLARDMSFEVFGQVGILYLMFLAGIEIDMYHLKKNLKKGLCFGLFTFLIPLGLGAVAAALFLGLSPLTAVLLASMFSAHTLIAYPIVSRFGITKSPAVVIAIAGTIVTVLGSLIVLAGVLGVERDGSIASLGPLLGCLALYCLGVVYLYPRVTRWFFKSYNDGIAQFVYVLVMVFLAAAVASWIGIEGVFGAFYAGLVLNRYIPGRSSLMSRLEFVGNAIFIPYFLIGVGMLIDIHVVTAGWTTLYIAAVMSGVAMLTKWLAALATQKAFGLTGLDRSVMYQLSNAHTAVALAVVMIGYNMDLFGVEILNGTVVMILVTCTVSSLGTERAATKLKLRMLEQLDRDEAATAPAPVSRTLITISNPLTAPGLVDLALMMRPQGESTAGKLFAVHVRSDNSASSRAIGRNSLDVAEAAASSADASLATIERFDLNVITGVVNTIAERDITEVIVGLHRRASIIDTFFGDKIESLIRLTNRMVVITRCFIPVSTVTRIVVAVPGRAQFETGFRRWVDALACLTRQIGCRIIFKCPAETWPWIRTVLTRGRYGIRAEHNAMENFDDFVVQANDILDDDLFVVVTARRSSVSWNSEMDEVPAFLQRYFDRNNLVVLYPGQWDNEAPMTMAETMSTDIVSPPSRPLMALMTLYRQAVKLRKRVTHRNRKPKIGGENQASPE